MINSIQFEKNTAEQTKKKQKKLAIKSLFILSWLEKYLCRK